MTRLQAGRVEVAQDDLVVEEEIIVRLREKTLLCTTCTPSHLQELVYGYLLSEGLIRSIQDVASLARHGNGFVIELRDEGACLKPPVLPNFQESSFTLSANVLFAAARECLSRGALFRETGGTHAAALGNRLGLINFFEDISRSCALEKVLGDVLLRGKSFDETFVFVSSRLPKRMLSKIARCGIPIVGAVSAPTFDAVEEAQRLGICVCGFVRENRLNVYSHGWRLGLRPFP